MDEVRFQKQLIAWQALPGQSDDESYLLHAYPSPLDAKFDALCRLYLEAEIPQREQLRRYFVSASGSDIERSVLAARADNLLSYIRRLARRLPLGGESAQVRWGVAAVALSAACADERDVLEASAWLKHAAMQAGIDLAPVLEAHAATSPPQAQRILTALRTSDAATIERIVRYHEGTG